MIEKVRTDGKKVSPPSTPSDRYMSMVATLCPPLFKLNWNKQKIKSWLSEVVTICFFWLQGPGSETWIGLMQKIPHQQNSHDVLCSTGQVHTCKPFKSIWWEQQHSTCNDSKYYIYTKDIPLCPEHTARPEVALHSQLGPLHRLKYVSRLPKEKQNQRDEVQRISVSKSA